MSENGLLHGIRAVELVHPLGQYCGRLLADLGADVIKVEAPSGDEARRMGPFAEAEPARSLYFDYYNTNKRSLALDVKRNEGRAVLKRLLESADIWIETDELGDALGGLDLDLRKIRSTSPRATLVSLTGFGPGGPYENYRASSLVVFAMSGLMHGVGPPDGPPVAAPGQLAFDLAATDAASGALMAILARRRTGQGQEVDVATLETLATELSPSPAGQRSVRRGNRHADIAPSGVFQCQDGAVELAVIMPAQWDALKEVLGQPPELTRSEWDNREFRREHSDELYELVASILRNERRDNLIERAQRLRLPCLPANTIADFVASVHPTARDYFVSAEHFGTPYRLMPGPPYRLSVGGWSLRRPPPALGEHSREILQKDLGYLPGDVAQLESAGVIAQASASPE